jgi:hypothetical protein
MAPAARLRRGLTAAPLLIFNVAPPNASRVFGGGGGHAGDVLATYDGATDITNINLYVNNDATVDGRLLLTGDHHNLNSWDLIA